MPATPPRPEGEMTFAEIRARGVFAQDIDENWMDQMVKRLFIELQRQLSQVENSQKVEGETQANLRSHNARTLAALERTLERLAKLEQQRALMRETKVAAKHDGARAELERRIDRLAAAANPPQDPAKPEG
jgi:hypothetical protein